MKEWIKANGGSPALIFVGLGLLSVSKTLALILIVTGVIHWIYISKWFPIALAWKKDISLNAKRDEEIIEKTRQVVSELGLLFGQHIRYKPSSRSEEEVTGDPLAAWTKRQNQSNQHDQATVAQFFESHFPNINAVVSSLYRRNVLSKEDVANINWWIGTSTYGGGLTSELTRIPSLLSMAADRLESGQILEKIEED